MICFYIFDVSNDPSLNVVKRKFEKTKKLFFLKKYESNSSNFKLLQVVLSNS